ncbi:MAG: RadC family protein, partial [Opitutales bacterium]
ARELLREAGSLAGLLRWSAEDFARQHGVGRVKALQLVATLELARRILAVTPAREPVFHEAAAAYGFLYPHLVGRDRECFAVMCLNRRNRLLKFEILTAGTGTASLVHPGEFFRPAIRVGATAVLAAHNHPSGDPRPSQPDREVTRQLRAAGQTLEISLLDHIVVGDPARDPCGRGFFSFAESGAW